ncbi:hypothetical protein KY290_025758 [Solanum tuberosum]|uniref:Uncharacterized protein n=1 Tax=Solanum tuberosum TaxID=4113 RepID=A0ABQ7UVN2_SOLTU|nr:hypothetical protein KY289_024813 [Solanum tuberosum]KAH0676799.1 hypothetical protein KY285_024600 [Solanum tuberosum]KAH0755488.1 hypothetical protein KY290_025758 [Solanum tuberosum]
MKSSKRNLNLKKRSTVPVRLACRPPRYGRKDSVDCSDDRDLRNPVPVEHPR